ncbi:MAG TPA: M15 family metallopeptidase [Chthonomonadaceae bacterium]|nr:M15 family metallopeptidase [Chthonomonadaceae bacterium]
MPNTPISPAEPVSQLRRIRIVESGEELVDFLAFCPELLLDEPRFHYHRETLLRRSVAEKLCRANRALPPGYHLAIIEGWRAPHIQRRMYRSVWNMIAARHPDWSEVQLKRVVNRFSAPDSVRVPPPHTTGGAVDVMLADASGRLLDHHSPYDAFDPHCFPFAAPGLSETARQTRTLLATALQVGGLTNYPSEYWHWSYGDQGWAYRGGHSHAFYAAITPPDWEPAPEDLTDHPLEPIPASDADK